MKNRQVGSITELHLQIERWSSSHNASKSSHVANGYLWFFLAIVLVVGFMILSHMGIAS